MSKQEEIDIGKKYYPQLTQMNNGPLKDEQLQNYVSELGHQIADVSHRPDLPYEFNVVNTSTPNAYALPGGFISVTRGLLFEMEHEGELAAVIGHEIAHATARHSAQQQTSGILANIGMIGLNVYLQKEGVSNPDLWMQGGRLVAGMGMASYSRSQEQQADRLGIEYMAKAGYDPQGMVDLQRTLLETRKQKPGFLQQLFSSHPLSEERIDDSKKIIDDVQSRIDRPADQQLNLFEGRVVDVWFPRRSAYTKMDSGVQQVTEENFKKAESNFRGAIEEYQNEALFHAWLGRSLQKQNDLSEARTALDRAVEQNPDVFRIRLFNGILYFEQDQYQTSLDELIKADDLLPNFPETQFYQGRNHEELGNRDTAAEFYIKYLKQVNEGEKAQYAYRRLQQWGYVK